MSIGILLCQKVTNVELKNFLVTKIFKSDQKWSLTFFSTISCLKIEKRRSIAKKGHRRIEEELDLVRYVRR